VYEDVLDDGRGGVEVPISASRAPDGFVIGLLL